MRTRINQCLETKTQDGPRRTSMKMRVLYGVDVLVGKRWCHAMKNGKPLFFTSEERAQAERMKLRALKAER